jgi:hypothetical protein
LNVLAHQLQLSLKNGPVLIFCPVAATLASALFLPTNVAVLVTVMGDMVTQKSWSAVGSHGQCRPVDGRSADTFARGFFSLISTSDALGVYFFCANTLSIW